MSKKELLNKLSDPAYRSEFVSNEIDIGLPMQIRAMREKKGWKQSFVAEQTKPKQPRLSLMEKPGYGNFSLNTLKKLAALFDVGLIVSFVPWGEMVGFVESLSRNRLEIVGFGEEYKQIEKTTVNMQNAFAEGTQLFFAFSSTTILASSFQAHMTTVPYQEIRHIEEPEPAVPSLSASSNLSSTIPVAGGIYDGNLQFIR